MNHPVPTDTSGLRATFRGRGWIGLVAISLGVSALPAALPTHHRVSQNTEVRWHGDLLVEVRADRFLRFRASGFNDHWIGTAAAPMDLGWDYSGVNDYVPAPPKVDVHEDGFTIELTGTKPSVGGRVKTRIEGRRNPRTDTFHYTLESRLTAEQARWRQVARRARRLPPDAGVRVEALDFHLNRISRSDITDWRNPPGDALLYDGILLAHRGEPWRFIMPVYTAYPMRPGSYPTIFWTQAGPIKPGSRMAYLDGREGGWIQEFLALSAPIELEQCWLGVDVHHLMPAGVPPVAETGPEFEAYYALAFAPVARREAQRILAASEPLPWRDRPEYQLPVFSRYSTFEERLSRSGQYVWNASSYDCAMDATVGYDDANSIRIVHTRPDQKSAWSAFTWGTHFDTPVMLKSRFRISAMVKTEGLTGEFRLAVGKHGEGSWLRANGEWRPKPERWFHSTTSLTGTNEWTRMHVDFDIDLTQEPPFTRHNIVLEYSGAGSIWFDNVRIQQIE